MADLERNVPETIQYYTQGAPCMITKNTYMKHGVANGTAGTMHSLTWADSSYRPPLPHDYMPGQLIRVRQPYSINVDLPVPLGLSKTEALRVATDTGKPVYYWHHDPTEAKVNPGIVHYFVEGAHCKLSQRICNEHGLTHGSGAIMSSMTWENKRNTRRPTCDTTIAGQLYHVAPPDTVGFRLDGRKNNVITVRTCLPVPLVKVSNQFTLLKYNHKTKNPGINLQCYSHNVKPMFAITFHKSQGQTLGRVVLHLHKRPGRSLRNITIQGLYVALSRVRLGSCIRVSFNRRTGLGYLRRLRRPKTFDLWVNNYDKATGLWVREGMDNFREKAVRSALATLKKTKNLQTLKLSKLIEVARVMDVEVRKNAKGVTNKPEYVNALYDEWQEARGITTAGKRLAVRSALATLKRTKSLQALKLLTLVELARVLDVEVSKNAKGVTDKPEYVNALYNEWEKARVIKIARKRLPNRPPTATTKTSGSPSKRRHIDSQVATTRVKLHHMENTKNEENPSTTVPNAVREMTVASPRKRHDRESQFRTRARNEDQPTTPQKRRRKSINALGTPDNISCKKPRARFRTLSVSKLDFGHASKGLRRVPIKMPLALANPHKRATGQKVTMMCYINATLQLLAASKVCSEHSAHAKGPIAKILQCLHSCDDLRTKQAMDDLLAHLPKRLFPTGQKGCAMEFMTWSVNNLGLGSVPSAVTRTVTEQKCHRCKTEKYTTTQSYGYNDATCEVTVKGNITSGDLAQRYDYRTQQCWDSNCPSTRLGVAANRVRFRENLYYGTVVVFRWGAHNHAVRLQKQVPLMTANRNFTKWQKAQYRLRAYTVFSNEGDHYKTFVFKNEILYCCDDSRIYRVSHDFSNPVGLCVLALYERGVGAYSSFLSAMPARPSRPALPRTENQPRTWIKVHGDGFCWIYAFLVAVTLLCQQDFPKGDNGRLPPSPRAIQLSNSVAPYAFSPDFQLKLPKFVNGILHDPGTYGGHRHFRRLLARIRPSFRFFVLDPTHTWIRYAAISEGQRDLPDEIMCLFKRAQAPCSHILEHDPDASQIKMVFAADRVDRNGKNIICKNTDVVVCWAHSSHFNALSPGSRADPSVTRFVNTLTEEPSRVPDEFPLNECDDETRYSDQFYIVDKHGTIEIT